MTGFVAAVDLGATSGRVIVGSVSPNRLHMSTIARFVNQPIKAADGLHWDIHGLYGSVISGLSKAFVQQPQISSIGVDSWAVDYGLLENGKLLGVPFHYRDERTAFGVSRVHQQLTQDHLFGLNGLQFLPFNTIYQLAAEQKGGNISRADAMLLIPDLFNFWLTNRIFAERTNASTTGLLNIQSGQWDQQLVAATNIQMSQLPEIIEPGFNLGTVTDQIARDIGASPDVVAVGSHDTASAVVAVPMDPSTSVYISCGTWGLVGTETSRPILTEEARAANFTNEGGVDGRNRFLHNVMGLWILSESVRHWESQGEQINLPRLVQEASAYEGEYGIFDVNDPVFLAPGDMPRRIALWLRASDQPVPESLAAFTRCIIESLATAFVKASFRAAELSGVTLKTIHIVGGGALNSLLCNRVSELSGLPVIVGPVEATAIGNILIQARAQGFVKGDLEELRHVVKTTFPPTTYLPALRGL